MNRQTVVGRSGLDAVALKPREVDLESIEELPFDRVTIDFEGRGALPSPATLEHIADLAELRVTIPVRATGFDPLGDDGRWDDLPADASVALVAGNPAYLTSEERRRSIAPRLRVAVERAPSAWVGTEGIEQLALETGATQFALLGPETEQWVRSHRSAGFEGGFAIYAPTVLTDDEATALDALGPYVARRRPVAARLPGGTNPDASATGRARRVLLEGCQAYGLTGDIDAIRDRMGTLRAAGVDHVVGYLPRGLEAFQAGR